MSAGNAVDNFFNKLPEELLVTIISLLPMREAARTSIISRRWRYLWRKYLHLDFNFKNITGKSGGLHIFSQHLEAVYVERVKKIIELYSGESLETFRLDHVLSEEYSGLIDQWIEFAVEKHVQKLCISLGGQKISPTRYRNRNLDLNSLFENGKPYEFPYWLFNEGRGSGLRHLSLNFCKLTLCPTFDNFKSLTSLYLKNTELPKKIVQNILINCSRLEWLSITHCSCLGRLKFGGGASVPLKLKHLNLSTCNVKGIEIGADVKLASFEYDGASLASVLHWNKAQLSRLCFGSVWSSVPVSSHALSNLSNDFPEIKTVLLTFGTVQKSMIPKKLPPFNKLEHLVLVFRSKCHPQALLKFVSIFVRASPFMQKLELHFTEPEPPVKVGNFLQEFYKHKHRKELGMREFNKHEHLKELELYNFLGEDSEVGVAKYVVNCAIALEKVKVCCHMLNYKGDGEWSESDIYGHTRSYERRRIRIHNKLCGIVRAGTQLTVA